MLIVFFTGVDCSGTKIDNRKYLLILVGVLQSRLWLWMFHEETVRIGGLLEMTTYTGLRPLALRPEI